MAGEHADTREYLVVHEILRVVLDRFVSAAERLDAARLGAVIGDRWRLFARGLHNHHEHEDTAFFPAIVRARPDVEPLVEQLEREHQELVARLDALDSAVDSLEAEPTDANRRAVRDSIAAVRDQLVPHLDVDDAQLVPVAAASVDARDWKRLSNDAFCAPSPGPTFLSSRALSTR
jgi:hemerythrin-like domain-containing protein